jgi:hypothetical protein
MFTPKKVKLLLMATLMNEVGMTKGPSLSQESPSLPPEARPKTNVKVLIKPHLDWFHEGVQ